MIGLNSFIALGVTTALIAVAACESTSGTQPAAPTPTIVLVHGAWADGSSWRNVIPLLEREGYKVVAVQNPLTSYAEDVAATKRVIDDQTGPVVVVGHSYGGAVISGAAGGNDNVKALVYVAAFGPEQNEVFGPLLGKYGPSGIDAALVPDKGGYVSINRASFRSVFAKDVSEAETAIMMVAQKPINSTIFGASITTEPAWKKIPAWYQVATEDQTIKPELQRFMAERMKATVSEVKSSHCSYVSHPTEVASVIREAVRKTVK